MPFVNGIELSRENLATVRECLKLDATEARAAKRAAEDALLTELANGARPKCCVTCGLIQMIDRADGVCTECHYDQWDGLTDEELDVALNPLDSMTPTERAQYEAEIEKFQRAEVSAAKKIAGPRYGWLKEQFENSGRDITDFTAAEGPESADFVANACGYKQTTWNDSRNITRREKEATRKVKEGGKAHQLKCAVAARKEAAPAKIETVTAAPIAASPESSLEAWARGYVANLAAENPGAARKLERSLCWQLGQLEVTAPDVWKVRAQLAFDAKVRS